MLITTADIDTLTGLLDGIQKGWVIEMTTVDPLTGKRRREDAIFQEIRGAEIKVIRADSAHVSDPAPGAEPRWIPLEYVVQLHIY